MKHHFFKLDFQHVFFHHAFFAWHIGHVGGGGEAMADAIIIGMAILVIVGVVFTGK
jgi:hypothetical protein